MIAILLLPILALAPYVAGHGFVQTLTIDGKDYKGNEPTQNGQDTQPSVIQRIAEIDPIKGAKNPDVNCGRSAEAASLVADAKPGSDIEFQWIAGGGQNVSFATMFLM